MVNEPEEVRFPPPLPDLGGGPPPRLPGGGPLLRLVLGSGLSSVALWAYFLAVMGEAAYRFDATPGELGILLGSFSVVFIPSTSALGAVADRWSPKRMLVLATAGLLGALLLALLAGSLSWLYASMAVTGLSEGLIWPARGALVPRLVEADRLVQANGMVAAASQVPMVLGPALAGLVVRLWGPDAPYAAGIGAVALAVPFLLAVPDRRRAPSERPARLLRDLSAGFREGVRVPELRTLFGLTLAVMFLVGLLITLEPLFVKDVLGRGQEALGFLWSAHGAGALSGSLALMALRRGAGREPLLIGAGVTVGGLGFLLYTGVAAYAAAAVGTFVLGVGYTLFETPAQALIQRVTREAGKVTGVFGVLLEAGPLAASVAVAALGTAVSVRSWLVGSAAAFTAVGLLGFGLARRPSPVPEEA